jgi:hypothetical protein
MSPGASSSCVYGVTPSRVFIGNEMTLKGSFGDVPVQVLLDAGGPLHEATVRSWSPSEVVVTVPTVPFGSYRVHLSAGCEPSLSPLLQVLRPPRVYIDNNVNNADGFDTITTLAYDPISGALTSMGPPTSTGVATSGRTGCTRSLAAVGLESKLFASGDTGVAVLDIDLATGALSPGKVFPSGSTGGGNLAWSVGAFVWQATDGGVVAWHVGGPGGDGLRARTTVTTTPATAMTVVGQLPSRLFTTRGGGTIDTWSVAYAPPPDGVGVVPVATPVNRDAPFSAGSNDTGLVYLFRRNTGPLLWVPTMAGIGVWQFDPQAQPQELTGSPVPLAAPSGTLTTPIVFGRSAVYIASAGSEFIAGATVDAASVPSVAPGSPWSFAPDLTNLSCITAIPGPTPDGVRLLAVDAGNRRVGVFDLPPGEARPVPVAGSPFPLTETPVELASGVAVLF